MITKILLAKAADVNTPPQMAMWLQELADDLWALSHHAERGCKMVTRNSLIQMAYKLSIREKYGTLSEYDAWLLQEIRKVLA